MIYFLIFCLLYPVIVARYNYWCIKWAYYEKCYGREKDSIIKAEIKKMSKEARDDWHVLQYISWAYMTLTICTVPLINVINNWIEIICAGVVIVSIWWIVYDLSLNINLKRKWYYIGTSSYVDKFFHNPSVHYISKSLLLTIGISLLIIMW